MGFWSKDELLSAVAEKMRAVLDDYLPDGACMAELDRVNIHFDDEFFGDERYVTITQTFIVRDVEEV